MTATRSYATKAWQVLTHVAEQPGRDSLHPLIDRSALNPKNALVIVITATAVWLARTTPMSSVLSLQRFDKYHLPVKYIAVGRKGRDLLIRRAQTGDCRFQQPARRTQVLRMFPRLAAWQWMNS